MRILIIDDDRELGEELADLLRGEGYAVELSSDGAHALRLIEQGAYDCCLLDYKMPGLNGIELLKRIRARVPGAAVLIVSGLPTINDLLRAEAVSAMVTGVIKKPFASETILAALRDCL